MTDNSNVLPQGAGATTGSATVGGGGDLPSSSRGSHGQADEYGSGQATGRALVLTEQPERSRPSTAVVVGAAVAGAIAGGAIPFMLAGRSSERRTASGGSGRTDNAKVAEEVLVNRPAQELYRFWRDFTNFPQFMDNIRSVTKLDEKRSHWVIEAPAGTSVEFDSRVTEEVPGRLIAWQSEEGASVPNRGRVEFIEQGDGRSTRVRATISYDPPGGTAGRLVAKLFGREPEVQARQDLNRFKEVMESGGGSSRS
jgi:uncharacterized membrane protein